MSDTPELCICTHQHATATQDGVTSVFHRCRARGCECAEYAPASERPLIEDILETLAPEFPGGVVLLRKHIRDLEARCRAAESSQ